MSGSIVFVGEITDGSGLLVACRAEDNTLQWQVRSQDKIREVAWQNIYGLPPSFQRLPKNVDIQLHMSLLLQNHSIIHIVDKVLVRIECGEFSIRLQLPWGATLKRRVSLQDTVASLKEGLRDPEGGILEHKDLAIIYQSRSMNEEKTLMEYDILPWIGMLHNHPDTLCCDLQIRLIKPSSFEYGPSLDLAQEMLKGMHMAHLPFSNMVNPQTIPFATYAPSWRRVRAGLNLYGTCLTTRCAAQKSGVYIPQGMGFFNMSKVVRQAKCPECQEVVRNITSCGFYKCVYSVEGEREGEKNTFKLENQRAPDDRYLYFAGDPSSISHWIYLEITTEP